MGSLTYPYQRPVDLCWQKKITDIFPDIKVLFTTGYSDLELEKKKIVISSENCLYIPFKAETLLNKLTEVSYH